MALDAFHFDVPEGTESEPKTTVRICRTDLLVASVQIVRKGGETNLHAHHGQDAIWWVISGSAAFYDEHENRFVLGKSDVMHIPADTKYWFEAIGEEPLEILHAVAGNTGFGSSRIDVTDPPERLGKGTKVQARKILPASV